MTRDIDGTFAPRAAVYEAARVIARRRRLPGDWLNDAVETYLVGRDVQARVFLDLPGLSLQVASPR
ncbi:MAG: hypothetical protein ACRDY2_08620 [Acidimicrobiales bacterium]